MRHLADVLISSVESWLVKNEAKYIANIKSPLKAVARIKLLVRSKGPRKPSALRIHKGAQRLRKLIITPPQGDVSIMDRMSFFFLVGGRGLNSSVEECVGL